LTCVYFKRILFEVTPRKRLSDGDPKLQAFKLPDGWGAKIKKRAAELGMTVSEYLRHLIRQDIGIK